MKPQIELHSVEALTEKTMEVFYTLQDENGFADVKMQIKRSSVLDHVIENEMNFIECVLADMRDIEQVPVHAATWLDENLNEAVKSYLVEQFNVAA